MLFRSITVFAVIIALSACQASSQYAGKGTLVLSKSAADGAERYFENYNSRAFAVANSGSGWASTSCAHQTCAWKKYGSAENNVISRCQSSGKTCGVFAVYQDIVWEGDIKLPSNSYENEKLLRLIERKNSSKQTSYTGTATVVEGSKNFKLKIRKNQNYCEGLADVDDKVWNIDCYGEPRLHGKLKDSSDSLYWGRAENGPFELMISEGDWPVLRQKLNKRIRNSAANAPEPEPIEKKLVFLAPSNSIDLVGKAIRAGDQRNGTLAFFDDKSNQVCSGSFEVWYGTTGEWQLECATLGKITGSLRIRGDNFSGKGRDSTGNAVTFASKS